MSDMHREAFVGIYQRQPRSDKTMAELMAEEDEEEVVPSDDEVMAALQDPRRYGYATQAAWEAMATGADFTAEDYDGEVVPPEHGETDHLTDPPYLA